MRRIAPEPIPEMHVKLHWAVLPSTFILALFMLLSPGKIFSQVVNPTQAGVIEGGYGVTPDLTGATSVFVQGNLAYVVGTGDELEILDITLPALPIHVGSIANGKNGANILRPEAVFVQGNYAYITSLGGNALEIVDVTNPANPQHKGVIFDGGDTYPYLKQAWGVYVAGDYAYVTGNASNALEIVDISNPTSPVHKGSISDGDGGASLFGPVAVTVSGNYAYVAGTGSFEIVDISNPAKPKHVASIDDGGGLPPYLGGVYNIKISGGFAYMCDILNNALEIIDISNPANPTDVGSLLDGAGSPPYLFNAFDITVSGHYAYVPGAGTLEVIDVTDPTAPVHAAGMQSSLFAGARSIKLQGNYAYVTSRGANALDLVDISTPTSPKITSTATSGSGGPAIRLPQTVYVSGKYAYICNLNNTIEILDVSNPSTPVHLSSITDGTGGAVLNTPSSIFVVGNYAYVASSGSNALEILDVTNPQFPIHKGKLLNGPGVAPYLNTPQSVYVSGNFAFLASTGSNALEIVDVTNPAAPVHKASLLNGAGGAALVSPTSLFVVGRYVYIIGGSNALEIVDIVSTTVPAPVHKGKILDGAGVTPFLSTPTSVTVSGSYAYVTSQDYGTLEIINVSNPAAPAHKGYLMDGGGVAPFLANPVSVALFGNYALVADQYSSALEIIDITNPANPAHYGSLADGEQGALLNVPTFVFVSGNYAYVTSKGLYQALDIVYLYGPGITQFTPTSAAVGSPVVITGQNFNTLVSVSFNGTSANVTSVGATSITATVPAGATLGKISINYQGTKITCDTIFRVAPSTLPASNVGQTGFTANWSDVGARKYFLDVSTDNFNSFLGGQAQLNGANAVFVQGNYAYIASQGSNALEIVDITNPAAPAHKGSLLDGGGNAPYLNIPDGIFVAGNYAYVVSVESNALEIIDVSNPATPVHAGSLLDGGGTAPYLLYPSSVFVSGNYAYIASYGSNSLEIVDVSNPANPVHAGSLVDGGGAPPYLVSAVYVYVSGHYAYVASLDSYALEIVDVSNPAAPVHAGSLLDGGGIAPFLSGASWVYVQGNYAYVTSLYSNALEIVDVSDPTNPTHKGSIVDGDGSAPFLQYPQSVFVAGNYAYITAYSNNALEVIDVSTPASPVHAGSLLDGGGNEPFLQGPWTVYVSGNFAYIASSISNSLEIIDITNPPSPKQTGSLVSYNNIKLADITSFPLGGLTPGTNYQYRVRSADDIASSVNSNSTSALTIPATPTFKPTTQISQSGFSMNWTASTGASGYYVDAATDKGFVHALNGISNTAVASNTQVISGAGPGVKYFFRVRSANASGSSPSSKIDSVSTIPASPVAGVATSVTSSSIVANWSSVVGTSTYLLDVSTDNFNSYVAGFDSLAVAGTSSAITGLSPGTNYQYRVRSANASGKSGHSNTISIVTLPPAPVATAATNITQNSFDVGWSSANGATSYSVDVATDAGFLAIVYNNVPATNQTSYSAASLLPDTKYYLRARANDASGSSVNSNVISVTTLSAVPTSQSTGITFTAVTSTSVTVNFSSGNGTSHLLVINPNVALSALPVNATSYTPNPTFGTGAALGTGFVVGNSAGPITVSGLSPATNYFFQIFDFNGSGGSENYLTLTNSTNPISASTYSTAPLNQPTNLTFSNVTANSVNVSFINATDNPSGYLAIRSTNSSPSALPVNGVSYPVGSVLGNSVVAYSGPSPSFFDGGLPTSTEYYYNVFAYNGSGAATIFLTANPLSNSITLDVEPPTITATSNPATLSGETPFNAIITDNVQVASAKIFYRGVSQEIFQSATMIASGAGGNYSVQVQTTWYDSLGLEYYFWAIDENGNSTAKPATTNISKVVSTINLPTLPSGTDQSSYRIVAFPYQLPAPLDNKITTVYQNVPWNDNTKASLWWWDPTLKNNAGGYDQYSPNSSLQTVDPGKGYWILTSNPATPQLANVPAPNYNRSVLFQMVLKPGWNEIGNPYPEPVNWGNVVAFNPNANISPLNTYDGSGYKPATVLLPFTGGFVKNNGSTDISIQIPFKGQTTLGGRSGSPNSDISQPSWNIFLHINQDGFHNELGGFGMDPQAQSGPDRFDNFNPPRFLSIPEVNFVNSDAPASTFSTDMVSSQQEYTWQFTPSGKAGQIAQLTWNPEISSSSQQLFLLDEQEINVIDMRAVSHYDFILTGKSAFRIFYGNNVQDKVTTQNIVAGEPYPNPLTREAAARINLALPDNKNQFQVSMQLYNGQGELIETLNTSLNPGLHQLEFTVAGQSLLPGIYIYRLAVASDNISAVYSGKIIKP